MKTANEESYLSISLLNKLVKAKLELDPDLQKLYVKGEISSWKVYPTAIYFSLKDESSVVSCMMWNSSAQYLKFIPKVGDEVLVRASINVYPPRGTYSLLCYSLELYGQGKELLALEELKKKLAAEGLFDPSKKKKIPEFPDKIGFIAGDGSAAEADIIRNSQRRWPLAELYFFPSLVQGKDAPKDLVRALKKAEEYPLDVLIIARGGGSSEDLSAFNDETLTREVAKCPIPTIAAIGHEIDYSLVDLAADLRVSTPTAAAEASTPDSNEIKQMLDGAYERLQEAWESQKEAILAQISNLSNRPFFKNPASMYSDKREEVEDYRKRLNLSIDHIIALDKERIEALSKHLSALNPYGVLSRGYSIATNEKGEILKSVSDVRKGEEVTIRLKDGSLKTEVK
ncbi:MAG: exodeoxyribonuclease VII large subunit [Bacilli bacterium]|nr:exodeoxyribonuclease VII large subunit [Bacilli bacterium]